MCNKVKIKEEKRCMNTKREIEKKDEKFSLIDVMNESVQNIDLYTPLNLNSQNRAKLTNQIIRELVTARIEIGYNTRVIHPELN